MRLSLDRSELSIDMEHNFEMGRRMGARMLRPYWDADLVDFLCRTPPELLNGGGRSKGLVRQKMARRLPSLGFERQKKVSFFNFFREVSLNEGPRLWQATGGAQALAELGIVDAPALDSAMLSLFSGVQPEDHNYRVGNVLFTEAWLRPRL
jgi:hypothetical protein